MSLNYVDKKGGQFAWWAPTWSWTTLIGRIAQSSCDMIVFNRFPHTPWVRLLVSRTRSRTFQMAHCETPVILDIAHWESPGSDNQTIIWIVTGRLWLAWLRFSLEIVFSFQRQLTAECDDHKFDIPHLELLGNQHSWYKKVDRDKNVGQP